MTTLFPIGTLTANVGTGTIDSISYSMFEPNDKCKSTQVYNNYVTLFQQQTMLTRKKSLPFIKISYSYKDIFSSEYNQIAHCVDSLEDNLNPILVVDFSQGINPSSITSNFVCTVTNARLFSKIANQKAHWIYYSNGSKWKLGTVSNIVTNTVITPDITSANQTTKFGTLTSTEVQVDGVFIYPVYECYTTGATLDSFDSTQYVDHATERGFVYNGNISFISKYKV